MYSQVIAWLKILLPIGALALLSTIFLFSRNAPQITQVPVLVGGMDPSDGEQVGAPFYAGTTNGGNAMTVSARTAQNVSDGGDGIAADDLHVTLEMPSGGVVDIHATKGQLETGSDKIVLSGGVEVQSATGYVMRTEILNSAIETVDMESGGPVEASGPATQIKAGKMRIVEDGENGEVRILFTEGVNLIYVPQVTEVE